MSKEDIFKQGPEYSKTGESEVTEEVIQAEPKKVDYKKLLMVAVAIPVVCAVFIGGLTLKNKFSEEKPVVDETATTGEVITLDDIDFENEVTFTYSFDEKDMLRSYGFTGDDIDNLILDEVAFSIAVTRAKEAMRLRLRDEYLSLSIEAQTAGSPEYQELLNSTWLGGEPIFVDASDVVQVTKSIVKENVDYEKVASNGMQLFIKLTLTEGDIIFMSTTPARWAELRESGNMLIEYTVESTVNNNIVTSVRELQP